MRGRAERNFKPVSFFVLIEYGDERSQSLTTLLVGSGVFCAESGSAALGLGLNIKGGRAVVGGGFVRTG